MVRAQAGKWAWVAHQSRRPPSDCAHTNRRTQQHVRARARTQPNQRRAPSFGGAPRARREQRPRPFLRTRPPSGPLGSRKYASLRIARGHFARPLRATTCVRTATPSVLSLKILPRPGNRPQSSRGVESREFDPSFPDKMGPARELGLGSSGSLLTSLFGKKGLMTENLLLAPGP